MTDDEIITHILKHEGRKYSNRPDDKGGPTKFGITLKTLRAFRHAPDLEAGDVEMLDESEARLIYRKEYIEKPNFNLIDHEGLRTQLIDFGVNSGPVNAVKALQRVLEAKRDGYIGGVTLLLLHRMGAVKCNNLVVRERCLLYARLVQREPAQAAFIEGWIRRAFSFMI